MGNCQAIDAATLIIQHPGGKVDKFFLPVTAAEVMKMNPGHYVALLISTTFYHRPSTADKPIPENTGPVRFTKIKLLRPTDTLALGQVYRLITTEDVMKGLKARKYAKLKKSQEESAGDKETERSEPQKESSKVAARHERHRSPRTSSSSSSSKGWQPSLHSISEAANGR